MCTSNFSLSLVYFKTVQTKLNKANLIPINLARYFVKITAYALYDTQWKHLQNPTCTLLKSKKSCKRIAANDAEMCFPSQSRRGAPSNEVTDAEETVRLMPKHDRDSPSMMNCTVGALKGARGGKLWRRWNRCLQQEKPPDNEPRDGGKREKRVGMGGGGAGGAEQIINDLLQMTEISHRAAGSEASP